MSKWKKAKYKETLLLVLKDHTASNLTFDTGWQYFPLLQNFTFFSHFVKVITLATPYQTCSFNHLQKEYNQSILSELSNGYIIWPLTSYLCSTLQYHQGSDLSQKTNYCNNTNHSIRIWNLCSIFYFFIWIN